MSEPDPRYPIACPRDYCAAPIGEPCRSSMGNVVPTHTPRRKAATAAGLVCGSPTADELKAARKKQDDPWGMFDNGGRQ